ncbi:hypothetical protein CDD81_3918 [Ophiocordyceps australis]|uniref:C2H2-type domain-containing protein n=1 Tax=Ophiocordyceps australis TaxID=1399860 RepID=A0A2C5YC73_9HYPO|nr:hypothetical protein CDD81_3918 [Ophiocordyceps australis]
MADAPKTSAYGAPASDTDFRKTWDLDEYAAKAKEREASERQEAKARYEAKLAGKKYHKPLTGHETFTTARRTVLDLSAQVGKTQLVPAGAGVGRRGRSAGFYCEACDVTLKDNKQYVEHLNTLQHLSRAGQTAEVRRASVDEVRARIDHHVTQRAELEKQGATSLSTRLALRKQEQEQETQMKREKRRAEAQRRRGNKEAEERVKKEYGEDVRVEGEHDEDDMLAQMGFTGFATSKKG